MVKMEAWEIFLKQQELELGADTVLKWLRSLKILRFDACNLYLEAKDHFQALWFEEHIRPKILLQLYNNNKKKIKVHLAIAAQELTGKETKAKGVKLAPQPPKFTLSFDALDPHARFDSFIVEQSNELPYKLLSTLEPLPLHSEEMETLPFNPIYLYGEKGSGKTHLLMATAQLLKERGLNVIYAHAEAFTEHVISAIRAGEMSHFRNAYRRIDALIIDDVHIFSRKAATQEEFFHTFNTLHLAGKQIILAANCTPQELVSVEPRLISRFEWGISLPVAPLSKPGLAAMLVKKGEALNYRPSQRILEFLLETFDSGSVSMTKALQALILRSHLNENLSGLSTISTTRASQLLQDLITDETRVKLSPEKIVLYVAEYFGIRPEDLFEKSQTRDRVVPRQIAMFFCRQQLKLPYTKIAALFNKDHSTVMSSIKLIQTGIAAGDSAIIDPVGTIGKKLKP